MGQKFITIDTIAEVKKLSPDTNKAFVDQSYKGYNFKEKGKVHITKTKKSLSLEDKRCLRGEVALNQ